MPRTGANAPTRKSVPTWLLLPLDRADNKNFARFMRCCSHIVPVGRITWFPGIKMHSTENFAWFRFDARHRGAGSGTFSTF
jgi:hypothetical protein